MNVIINNNIQADQYSKQLGFRNELASGLIKLNIENLGDMNPDSWYSTYHYSHPPLMERLRAIEDKPKKE
jgi:STE24 endopeptidase